MSECEYDTKDKKPEKVRTNTGLGLINRKHCRDFALRWAQEKRRGCNFQRVSKQYLDDIETKVMMLIQKSIDSHRSVGKTITDFL